MAKEIGSSEYGPLLLFTKNIQDLNLQPFYAIEREMINVKSIIGSIKIVSVKKNLPLNFICNVHLGMLS